MCVSIIETVAFDLTLLCTCGQGPALREPALGITVGSRVGTKAYQARVHQQLIPHVSTSSASSLM